MSTVTVQKSAVITCVGGAVINRKYTLKEPHRRGTSNPATLTTSFGGVARNVAETLARLGHTVSLITRLGDDAGGEALRAVTEAAGVSLKHAMVDPATPTADYTAILEPSGELVTGVASMAIFDSLTSQALAGLATGPSQWVFADCNLPADALSMLMAQPAKLVIDTVSQAKAQRLPADLSGVEVLFTNRGEAHALTGLEVARDVDLIAALRKRGAKNIVLSRGAEGHCVLTADEMTDMTALETEVVDVTGAGDAMIAGTLHGLVGGHDLATASKTGACLAALTIASDQDVVPGLSLGMLAAKDNDPRQS
ncbi:MAG: PfkB family carbohydrate kinase [Pseudomonadota bacterium]